MKKLIAAVLALCLICSQPIGVSAERGMFSGDCGKPGSSLTWSYDANTNLLTISGSGEMRDFEAYNAPWFTMPATIRAVAVCEGVVNIGRNAFAGLQSLASVTLPTTLTRIGDGAFYGCISLPQIELPAGLTQIGANAFGRCWALTALELPDGITRIEESAFEGCGFTSIVLPDGITEIGKNAFRYAKLEELRLPAGLTELGVGSFYSCSELREVTIPEGLTALPDEVFRDCKKLTTVRLPDGLRSIGKRAFYACEKLEQVALPSSLQKIDAQAFTGCKSLCELTLPEQVDYIGAYALSGCSFTELSLPDNLRTVETGTFSGCKALEEIRLPANCESIGSKAFCDCAALKRLDLPASVASLGEQMLDCCFALEQLTVRNPACTIALPFPVNTDKTVICGYYGSTAQAFAAEAGCSFELLDTCAEGVHNWDAGEVTLQPGCTEEGNAFFTCVLCGLTKNETLPALSHEFAELTTLQEPTCTADGAAVGICQRCHETVEVVLPALPHEFVETARLREPTCSLEGEILFTCALCGLEDVRPLEMLPHNYVLAGYETAPTYFSEGEGIFLCVDCGARKTEAIERLKPGTYYQQVLYDREDWSGVYLIGGIAYGEDSLGNYSVSGLAVMGTFANPSIQPYQIRNRVLSAEHQYGHPMIFEKLPNGNYTIREYPRGSYLCNTGEYEPRLDPLSTLYPGIQGEWKVYVDENGYLAVASASQPSKRLLYDPFRGTAGAFILADTVTIDGVTYPAAEVYGLLLLEEDPCVPFRDVDPLAWYHPGIDFAVGNGLFNGVSSNRFGVDSPMTRAMFVTVLWRLEGKPRAFSGGVAFDDVADGAWYSDAVAWASSQGIVNGTSETTFSPDASITREQMAVLMHRYARWLQLDVSQSCPLDSFPDAGQVSEYAKEALGWSTELGIITGTTDGHSVILSPQGRATRAQVATILMRFVRSMANPEN